MRNWFIGIVALQLCFIVGEAAQYQMKLRHGDEVLLRVVPVDPRSLFMGNYFALGYDISSVNSLRGPNRLPSGVNVRQGQTIWIGLRPAKPYARVVSVSLERPIAQSGIVLLRGTCSRWERVNYGIERYYIPAAREHDAIALSQRMASRRSSVAASISVGSDGRGMVKGLYENGHPVGY